MQGLINVWNLFSFLPQRNEDTCMYVDVEALTPKKKEVERRALNRVEGFKLSNITYNEVRSTMML